MNDYRITLTNRAKSDIIDIGDYIAYTLSEPDTSKNFIEVLKVSISHLKDFPHKFPLIQDDIVIILRIGYNRRNWSKIL